MRAPGCAALRDQRVEQAVGRVAAGVAHHVGRGAVDDGVTDRRRRGPGVGLQVQGRDAGETCGVAIGMPLMVLVAVLLVFQAEVIDEPGANRSRQLPKFE